jgi:hypothetical protein
MRTVDMSSAAAFVSCIAQELMKKIEAMMSGKKTDLAMQAFITRGVFPIIIC